jgi:lysozyme
MSGMSMIGRYLGVIAAVTACTVDAPVELAQVSQEMAVCADGPTVYGIDVSRYQGDINWDLVAGHGVKYAFIQISRSLTDIDAKFPYNWRRAKEVGILRGAYQRFRPGQDVIGQADLFLQKLGPYEPGDLPPVLDVEDADGLSPSEIAARVRQWIDHVEPRLGIRPIIYTGYYFWRDSVGGADFSQYPLWIANYSATCPLVPPAWTRWTIHQYSSTAMIPGITANTVDVNRFNGTLADLEAMARPPTCGDGTCNGDETADTCTADCTPCQVIDSSEAGSIVDDASACFRAGGNPQFVRSENAGFGSSLQWTHTTDAASAANYGHWQLHFARGGRYRVEAFTPAPFNGSRQAVYRVTHGDTTSLLPVDQSAVDGWNLVGELEFVAGGHGQSVRLDDNTGEPAASSTKLVFDALRLTRLDDDEAPPPPPDPGGCMATPRTGALALALLVLVGCWRRRR